MPVPASTKYWNKFDNGTLGLLLIFLSGAFANNLLTGNDDLSLPKGLVAQKQADTDEPTVDDLFEVGTVATILQLLKN